MKILIKLFKELDRVSKLLSDNPPGLPPGEPAKPDIEDIDEPYWMEDGELYGEHLLKTVEAVDLAVVDLYGIARFGSEAVDTMDGDYIDDDAEIVNLMTEKLPEAFNELGNMMEEAREIDRYLGQAQYTTDDVYGPSRAGDDFDEEKFLENYRKAEKRYRKMFEHLGFEVDDKPLNQYLKDEYDLNLQGLLPQMPEPRAEEQEVNL